nr:unnamed protein product [Haemonchus contortus]
MSLVVIVLAFLVANAAIQGSESLPLPVVMDGLRKFNTSLQEYPVKVVEREKKKKKAGKAFSERSSS